MGWDHLNRYRGDRGIEVVGARLGFGDMILDATPPQRKLRNIFGWKMTTNE